MQTREASIPGYLVTFFTEVNDYIEVLPPKFKEELNNYMHIVAWQIVEELPVESPDDLFEDISLNFKNVKKSVLH